MDRTTEEESISSDETVVAAPAADEKTARWEDYIDVYFSPSELFRRRAADRVAPPLLTLLALALLFYIVLLPANAMVMRAAQEHAGNPEAAAVLEQMGTVFQVLGGIMVPVMYLIVIATTAALLWVIGRIAEIRIDFSRALLIATYGGFIYLLAQVAGSIAVMLHGAEGLDIRRDMSFGISRFIANSEMNPTLLAVFGRFEIFAIWQALVWSIGVREIYRTTTARALIVGFGAWLLFVIPGIISGFFTGMGQPG